MELTFHIELSYIHYQLVLVERLLVIFVLLLELIHQSCLYSYQCGSQLFPVIYDESYEPSRNREEKCLNHSIGDIVSFYIDTDFNSSTPNESVDFYLHNQHLEKEGCFYVEVSNDIRDSDLDELWELFFESNPNSQYNYRYGNYP